MDLELLLGKVTHTFEYSYIIDFVRKCRLYTLYNVGIFFAEYFIQYYPNVPELLDEYAMCLYYVVDTNDSKAKAHAIYDKLVEIPSLSEFSLQCYRNNDRFLIPHIKDRYIQYPEAKIRDIKPNLLNPFVTFTITSCKRLALFEKTMNSFINCCTDLSRIDQWICIDDNSSEEDRETMKTKYPFFTFILKDQNDKGHARSMNMLLKAVKSPYMFHMEDDWQFYRCRPYITQCLEVLSSHTSNGGHAGNDEGKVVQCLINRNYAETPDDIEINGGKVSHTHSGMRYILQQQNEKVKGRSNTYWPHYSLRPSLIKTEALHKIGFYDEGRHFEMEYANRYVSFGYRSAFLDNIHCMHIGRLTSERHTLDKPNAYDLNSEVQFSQKRIDTIKAYIVNLDRRSDRWEEFVRNNRQYLSFVDYERYPAVDGKNIKYSIQLSRLFDKNDYNWRRGMIGCALSHIKMWIELLHDPKYKFYLVLEDDIKFSANFVRKFYDVCDKLNKNQDWDIAFVGHHPRIPEEKSENSFSELVKCNATQSLQKSLGGTFGYLINKKGARQMLEFIDSNTMTNCIDTMQQKAANVLNVYYATPMLIYSEVSGSNTDIQHDYDTVTIDFAQKIKNECEYYVSKGLSTLICSNIVGINNKQDAIFLISSETTLSAENIQLPHYTIENRCIVFLKTKELLEQVTRDRFLHPLKDYLRKNGEYSIDSILS